MSSVCTFNLSDIFLHLRTLIPCEVFMKCNFVKEAYALNPFDRCKVSFHS